MAFYPFSKPVLSVQVSPSPPPLTLPPQTSKNSDIATILTCLLCIIFCTVGIMGLVKWTCLKHPSPSISTTNDTSERLKNKKKIVESLPRLKYKSYTTTTAADNDATDAAECIICLSEFVDRDDIRVLPLCSHVFHVDCIDTWLIRSRSLCCPSCRQVMVVGQCHELNANAFVDGSPPSELSLADYLP